MNRTYRWYFHFNASHNMYPEELEKTHVHTFLLCAFVEMKEEDFSKQNQCGEKLKEYLSQYRGAYLNDLEHFANEIPTIEKICEVLYNDFKVIAKQYGAKLLSLEVGDSPVAMFSMGEQLLLGFTYQPISDEAYHQYVEQWRTREEEVR